MTAKVIYRGELRSEATHNRSGQTVITDAPLDNHGKGQAFSPTDLLATSLVSCMLTVIGIEMEGGRLPKMQMTGEVVKTMASEPRRVGKLSVRIHVSGTAGLGPADRALLENTAHNCPVAKSLHPDIELEVDFSYDT